MLKEIAKKILVRNHLDVQRTVDVADIRSAIAPWRPKALADQELVRLGSTADGGYLLPSDFRKCRSLVSPGVGDNNSFERAFQEQVPDSQVFQIDGTIDKVPAGLSNSHYKKINLGSFDSEVAISLSSWMREIQSEHEAQGPFLLQMDIEGAEYSSITATPSSTLDQFNIVLVELHGLDRLTNFDFLERFKLFSEKLLETHTVVHLHPNNRRSIKTYDDFQIHPTLEATLVRTSDYDFGSQSLSFPNALDQACDPDLVDVKLSSDWV